MKIVRADNLAGDELRQKFFFRLNAALKQFLTVFSSMTDGHKDARTYGRKLIRKDGRMDGRTDGYTDEIPL